MRWLARVPGVLNGGWVGRRECPNVTRGHGVAANVRQTSIRGSPDCRCVTLCLLSKHTVDFGAPTLRPVTLGGTPTSPTQRQLTFAGAAEAARTI